jgi:hypothetical protein
MRKGGDISKRKEGSFAHTSKDRTFRTLLARLCSIYNFRFYSTMFLRTMFYYREGGGVVVE